MWQLFRRKRLATMRPYVPGENLAGISVNKEDTTITAQLREAGSLNQCITDLEAKLAAMTEERNTLKGEVGNLSADVLTLAVCVYSEDGVFYMENGTTYNTGVGVPYSRLQQQLATAQAEIVRLNKWLTHVKAQEICELVAQRDRAERLVIELGQALASEKDKK